MGIFNKKNPMGVGRTDFRRALRRASSYLSGGGRRWNMKQRLSLEKEFEGKYGPYISKKDVRRELREQRQLKAKAKSYSQRMQIERKIRAIEKITGVKRPW